MRRKFCLIFLIPVKAGLLFKWTWIRSSVYLECKIWNSQLTLLLNFISRFGNILFWEIGNKEFIQRFDFFRFGIKWNYLSGKVHYLGFLEILIYITWKGLFIQLTDSIWEKSALESNCTRNRGLSIFRGYLGRQWIWID